MIRFPRMHVAQSAVNRILNTRDNVQPPMGKPSVPAMPDVAGQGMKIDQALQAPVGDVAPIEGMDEALALRALDV